MSRSITGPIIFVTRDKGFAISTQLLLNDAFAPITSSMGFVEASIELVIDKFKRGWQEDHLLPKDVNIKINEEEISGNLEEVILKLFPLKAGSTNRFLFIPTRKNWTTCVENEYRGTDRSFISSLARNIGCRGIHMIAIPHTYSKTGKPLKGRQGARVLRVFNSDKLPADNLIRMIWLVNDAGKWEFDTKGDPFSFENIEQYKKRRLTDRFTFEMMEDYLMQLGLSPFDEHFYFPNKAKLVKLKGWPTKSNLPTYATLKEVRKRLNFK